MGKGRRSSIDLQLLPYICNFYHLQSHPSLLTMSAQSQYNHNAMQRSNARRQQDREMGHQYRTQSPVEQAGDPPAYDTSGNSNNIHDRSDIQVVHNTIHGSQHVSTSHNNSTTTDSYQTKNVTSVFSNNIGSNHWDSNNCVEGNVGSFNGTTVQQVMSAFGSTSNAMPFPGHVPTNFTSGSWYSNNHNSNHATSGNNISNNRDSFNATARGEVSLFDYFVNVLIYPPPPPDSFGNQANATESHRYNMNHHRSTTSHNSQLLNAQQQSGSTVWSYNVDSNYFDSDNRIEGNVRAFNGVSIDQNPISAITGARARNNPFSQSVPFNLNTAGGITAYSHNENSNHSNSRNTISNNTDSFNTAGAVNPLEGLNLQQVEQVIATCRSLGYNDEELQDLRLEHWHHEVLKLCLGDGGRSADQSAHDPLHQLMQKIRRHRSKGHVIPNRTKLVAPFDAVYQELLH
ncbi:hypothetical protein D9758_007072 [Tetrapyrgos nigripes]|uniref:Uncharacterized protein n=1 Tax=Tetrapyrgos nigripes TaxID=182062 RepID=A0A8H5GDL3_9AGAR|nr:hypothetical protein D9758_007072 [Tetrapyrgos nigripes]